MSVVYLWGTFEECLRGRHKLLKWIGFKLKKICPLDKQKQKDWVFFFFGQNSSSVWTYSYYCQWYVKNRKNCPFFLQCVDKLCLHQINYNTFGILYFGAHSNHF